MRLLCGVFFSVMLVGCGGSVTGIVDQVKQDYARVSAEVDRDNYSDSLVTYKGGYLLGSVGHELEYKPLSILIAEEEDIAKSRGVERDTTLDSLGGLLLLKTTHPDVITSAYGNNYEVVVKNDTGAVILREIGSDDVPRTSGRSFFSISLIYTGMLNGPHTVEIISLLDGKKHTYEVNFQE